MRRALVAAVAAVAAGALTCPGGHTSCPSGDACCVGVAPDAYAVEGGYGCMPPGTANYTGCAGGGTFPDGCCCAPGPSAVDATGPNVLVVGDSVSAGYLPHLRAALGAGVNVQHGPDNLSGGYADGAQYGALCAGYFARTPLGALPRWDVVTFNFGLHDQDPHESVDSYADNLRAIATTLAATGAPLLLFTTTMPGGSAEPLNSTAERRVQQLNAAALGVAAEFNVPAVDLYGAMQACAAACASCQPHCDSDGYEFLVQQAIAPAVKAALGMPAGMPRA